VEGREKKNKPTNTSVPIFCWNEHPPTWTGHCAEKMLFRFTTL